MKLNSILNQLADGFDTTALVAMLLPLAFPIVAILDGGADAYIGFSAMCVWLAAFFSAAIVGVCLWLSSVCEWLATTIERNRREREETQRAFHAYLLNGGRI